MQDLTASLSSYIENFEATTTRRNGWTWVSAAFADYGGAKLGANIGFRVGIWAGGFHGAAIGVIGGCIVVAAVASAATLLSNMEYHDPSGSGHQWETTGDAIQCIKNPFDYVGLEHNILVDKILLKKDEIVVNGEVNTVKLLDITVEAAKEIGYDAKALSVSDVEYVIEETSSLSLDEKCVNQYFAKEIVEHPENAAVLNLEQQQILALITLPSKEDLARFTEGFETLIVESSVNGYDKQELLSSSSLIKNSMVAYKIK